VSQRACQSKVIDIFLVWHGSAASSLYDVRTSGQVVRGCLF